eukprot:COSAG03_NODE_9133_length_743_cov_124.962733_1_plen_39_part_00
MGSGQLAALQAHLGGLGANCTYHLSVGAGGLELLDGCD